MHFSIFADILVFLAFLPSITIAIPVNSTSSFAHLDTRAPKKKCNDPNFSLGPCICGDELGLRKKSLSCQQVGFHFKNQASTSDGALQKVIGAQSSVGSLECDHVVELQFIAASIPDNGAACQHFLQNKNDFQTFFDEINSSDNLVFVEDEVNTAKLSVFSGTFNANTFKTTNSKAASGVVSYLELLKTGQFFNVATTISSKLDSIVGGTDLMGGFQTKVNNQVAEGIRLTKQQLSSLAPRPAPNNGIQFVTPNTPNNPPKGCTRKRSTWEGVKGLIVRAVTGKTTSTPTPAACELPTTSTAGTSNAKQAKGAQTPKTQAGKAAKNTKSAKGSVPKAAKSGTATKTSTAKTSAAKVAPKKAATTKTSIVKTSAAKVAPKKVAKKTVTNTPVKTSATKIAPKKAARRPTTPKKAGSKRIR